MSGSKIDSYQPLNTLKMLGEGIWMVDGPIIKMDFPLGFKMPFSTRMVVVRLGDGRLWVHSPIAPDQALFDQIDALGEVAFLIAPNSIHYWYIPDWAERYPDAAIHIVPGLDKSAKRPLPAAETLTQQTPATWADDFDMLLFRGSVVQEAVFLHKPSRTVILVDLIENFEPQKVHSAPLRLLMSLAGILDPKGSAPRDYRMTFMRHRAAFAANIQAMLGWQAEKVIMAHGRPYLDCGWAELQRAFAWVRGVSD